MIRHEFRAEIRRGPDPGPAVLAGAPSRLDAPPGQEHGAEEAMPIIEKAAKEPAGPGELPPEAKEGLPTEPGAAPGADGPGPEAAAEPQAEGGGTPQPIKIPDIKVPELEQVGKSDQIISGLRYTTSTTRGGAQPTGFGVTRSFDSHLTNILITPFMGWFVVTATLEHPVTWQVRSGTGPGGQVDISSAGSSNITAANYAQVADDLTPDMSDLNGRPPRDNFWAEDLTIRHELVHVADDQRNGPLVTGQIMAWLGAQTAASVAGVTTLLNAVPGRFAAGLMAALSTEAGERNAYGDGAPYYKARSDIVREWGAAGRYS